MLNKLKWSGGGIQGARVAILHRGAPADRRIISGRNIIELGRGFMLVVSPESEVEIPYHRILWIDAGDQVIWDKKS